MIAITTSFKKSFDKRAIRLFVFAPNTLRIPISFVRRSVSKAAKPNNPRQEIKMVSQAKYFARVSVRSSVKYCAWNVSSRKLRFNA